MFRSRPFYVYKDGFTIKFSWERPASVAAAPNPEEVATQYGDGKLPHNVFQFSSLLAFKQFAFSRVKLSSTQRGKENSITGEDFTLLLLFENALVGLSGLSAVDFNERSDDPASSLQLRIILSSFGRELFSAVALHPIFANIAVIASTTALYVVDVRTPLVVLSRVEISLFPAHLTFQKNVGGREPASAVDTFLVLWSFKPPGVFLFKMTIKSSDVTTADEDELVHKSVSERDRRAAASFVSRVLGFGGAGSQTPPGTPVPQSGDSGTHGGQHGGDEARAEHAEEGIRAAGRLAPTEQPCKVPQLRDAASGVIPHVGEFFTTIFTESVEEEAFAVHPEALRRAEVSLDIVAQLYTLPEHSVDDPNSSIIGFGFSCTNPRAVCSYRHFLEDTVPDAVCVSAARADVERMSLGDAHDESPEEGAEPCAADSTWYDCSCYTLTGGGELWYCSTSAHFAPPSPDSPTDEEEEEEEEEHRPLLTPAERHRMREGGCRLDAAAKRFKEVCDFASHTEPVGTPDLAGSLEGIKRNLRQLVFSYPETLDDCRRILSYASAAPRETVGSDSPSGAPPVPVGRVLGLLREESERRGGNAGREATAEQTICEKLNAAFFAPLCLHANAERTKPQEHDADEGEHGTSESTPTTLDAMFTQSQAKKELDRKAELYGWKLYSLPSENANWVKPYTLSKEQHVSSQLADIFAQSRGMSREMHAFFAHPDDLLGRSVGSIRQPSDYLCYLRTDPEGVRHLRTAHRKLRHRQSSRRHVCSSSASHASAEEASDDVTDTTLAAQEGVSGAHHSHTLRGGTPETASSGDESGCSDLNKRLTSIPSGRQSAAEGTDGSQVLWDEGDSVLDKDGFLAGAGEGHFNALDDEHRAPRESEGRAAIAARESGERSTRTGSLALSGSAERGDARDKKRVTIVEGVRARADSQAAHLPLPDAAEGAPQSTRRVTIAPGEAPPSKPAARTPAAGERSAVPRTSSLKPPQEGPPQAARPSTRPPQPLGPPGARTRETGAAPPSSQPSEPQSQPARPPLVQAGKPPGARPSSQAALPVMVRKSAKGGDPKSKRAPRKSLFM